MAGRTVIHEDGTNIYDVYISDAAGLIELCAAGAGTIAAPIWQTNSIEVNVYLTEDIDMNDVEEEFDPPTDQDLNLFDGQNHKIANIKVCKFGTWSFFNLIGIIRDLEIKEANITASEDIIFLGRVNARDSLTYNVKGTGVLSALDTVYCLPVSVMRGRTVENCSFNGNVTAETIYICYRTPLYGQVNGFYNSCWAVGIFRCTNLYFSHQNNGYSGAKPILTNCFCVIQPDWSQISNIYFTDRGSYTYLYLLNQNEMTENFTVSGQSESLFNTYLIIENDSHLSAFDRTIERSLAFIQSESSLRSEGWAI